ncbi:MAG: choice-of-anchor F family protein [Desulfobulbaceae bacterium]|nr:choice-of-anchor F family protein [Desulfobulbaceae bacterium]
MKADKFLFATALAIFSTAGAVQAGIIDSWNMDGVDVYPGPYTEYVTYYSTIYTDFTMTDTNGVISWKETDVKAPGLKVVNGDDVDGSNCLMTTGYNPYDMSDKQCTDPLQSSKRFKLKNTFNAPVDLNFNVVDGETSSYRALQKWTDGTDLPWSGFTIELGFTVYGEFVPSADGDDLGFSDSRGRYFTRPVTSYQSKADILSALFAQGLAGAPDKYHPEPGYFNPVERMSFGLVATEDKIASDSISASYSDVFDQWVNSPGVPIAIFWDDDGDINTDNALMANCADAANLVHVGTHTGDDVTGFSCDGQWVTFRAEPGLDQDGLPYLSDGVPKAIELTDLAPVVYTSIEAAVASGDPQPMYVDYIEDAANLGFNFWITVGDTSSWPTPGSFTVRYTPVPSDGEPLDPPGGTEQFCTDGLDNDGDGLIDCADPDCEGIEMCGPEGKGDTCSDGYDNDGDGQIDCYDSGCAKNRACR